MDAQQHEDPIAELERRTDRIEAEVGTLIKSVGVLNEKLSAFMREYNQRSRTDWKLVIAALAVMLAAITAASGTIMAFETQREASQAAALQAVAEALAASDARQAQIDNRIIDDYRREADLLRARINRLEDIHLSDGDG